MDPLIGKFSMRSLTRKIPRLLGLRPHEVAHARHNQCKHCFCSRLLATFCDSTKKIKISPFSFIISHLFIVSLQSDYYSL